MEVYQLQQARETYSYPFNIIHLEQTYMTEKCFRPENLEIFIIYRWGCDYVYISDPACHYIVHMCVGDNKVEI